MADTPKEFGHSDEPDPRFLGGESAVLTDARQMALVIAIGWKGECDIVCNVENAQAVEWLRAIADQIEQRGESHG